MSQFAIVVAAFNRPFALDRLLNSILNADYSGHHNVDLIISIDFSGNNECFQISEKFEWEYGKKLIINHENNLGLKAHIIECGSFVNEYEAIVLLEDDVFVGRYYFDFAVKSFNNYQHNANIVGIALFSLNYNEIAYCPFNPITDGNDTYFMQVPASWGQVFWKSKWDEFTTFLFSYNDDFQNSALPNSVKIWGSKTSWKKYFYQFMMDMDYYFVFPREGYATNFGDVGTHYSKGTYVWQNSLAMGKRNFNFGDFATSVCIYDAHMELSSAAYKKITNNSCSIEFDVNGSKDLKHIKTDFLISVKSCNKSITEYSMDLYPYENNVLLNNCFVDRHSKYKINLARTENFFQDVLIDRLEIDSQRMLGKEYVKMDRMKMNSLLSVIKRALKRFINRKGI